MSNGAAITKASVVLLKSVTSSGLSSISKIILKVSG